MTGQVTAHDTHTYGPAARQLDRLFNEAAGWEKVAERYNFSDHEPFGAYALKNMESAWSQYEAEKAAALMEMQREVDETMDALLASTGRI